MTRRLKRKKAEASHAVRLITENQEIIQRYCEYYEEITTTNRKDRTTGEPGGSAKNQEETRTRENRQRHRTTDIRRKKRKACDSQDWNHEMMIDGG